jgi:hypothetical protein
MSTTVLPRRPGTGRGLRSTTQLLDVNAELGVATAKVDLAHVTEATTEVVTAATLAANTLMGQLFAERLLGLDIRLTKRNLNVAIPGRTPVIVRVSLAIELPHLLAAVRLNGVGTLAVDVVVLDSSFAEWAKGRMEWTVRQRRCAEWPINSP